MNFENGIWQIKPDKDELEFKKQVEIHVFDSKHFISTSINDTSDETSIYELYEKENKNTIMRHTLNSILSKNPIFVACDYYLAAKALLYVYVNKKSLAICECSGSGKTTFLSILRLITENMLSQSYMELIDGKEKNPNYNHHQLGKLLTINIDFRTVFEDKRNNIQGLCEEVQFLISLIQTFVRKMIPYMYDDSSEHPKIKDFDVTKDSIDKIKLPARQVQFLAERLARILAFIAKCVGLSTILKPVEDPEYDPEETKRIKTIKGTKVEQIIFLIDEIDILESKNITSLYNAAGQAERNLFIQIMQLAADKDYMQDTYKNVQYIYTSIMPVSKDKHFRLDPITITDFSDFIIKFNRGKSFGEIDFPKFSKIASDKTKSNLLTELINKLEEQTTSGNYFDTLSEDQFNTKISQTWEYIDKVWKDEKVEGGIIEKVYHLFNQLFGQPTYIFKNDLNVNKNRFLGGETNVQSWRNKINISSFMSFLMNESIDDGISLESKYHIVTETNMDYFWRLAYSLILYENKGEEDFQLTESEFKIMFKDRKKVFSNSTSYRHQGLYYFFHLGFKRVSKVSGENGKYQLDWVNENKKISFQKGFNKFIEDNKRLLNYTSDEEIVIKDCFSKAWWDELLKQMKRDFRNVEFKLSADTKFREIHFRIEFFKLIKAAVKEKFIKKFAEFDKTRLEHLIEVKPEKSMNLLEPSTGINTIVRPDVSINMVAGYEGGKKFYVIVELKVHQENEIRSIEWATIESKKYDLISHIQDEKHLIIVANLSEKKDNPRAYEFSFATKFIDGYHNYLERTQR